MIVLVGGEKGGTGKTTVATNLAVALALAKRDVLLIDTDKQGSAAAWSAARSNNTELARINCFEKYGNVADAVRDAARRYEEVIIDAGGRDSPELRSAMVVADKLFVPIKASQFDLWTIQRMNEMIETAKGFNPNLLAWAIVSMAPTNPVIQEAAEAQAMLREFDQLHLADTVIRERKAYRDAVAEGKGVLELQNDKAIEEIQVLKQEIYDRDSTAIQQAAAPA